MDAEGGEKEKEMKEFQGGGHKGRGGEFQTGDIFYLRGSGQYEFKLGPIAISFMALITIFSQLPQ